LESVRLICDFLPVLRERLFRHTDCFNESIDKAGKIETDTLILSIALEVCL
jgi:hypothetical protein